jgi:hypothetical protein
MILGEAAIPAWAGPGYRQESSLLIQPDGVWVNPNSLGEIGGAQVAVHRFCFAHNWAAASVIFSA